METARITHTMVCIDTGWLCLGRARSALHLLLKRLRGLEHGRIARRNGNSLASGGVTAFSGITMLHAERAEAEKLYLFAGGDCVHNGVQNGVNNCGRGLDGQVILPNTSHMKSGSKAA